MRRLGGSGPPCGARALRRFVSSRGSGSSGAAEPGPSATAAATASAHLGGPSGDPLAAHSELRRRWEGQVQTAFRSADVDTARYRQQVYDKYYVHRNYTPLLTAFPLLDRTRWRGLKPLDTDTQTEKSATSVLQPENPHVVRAAILGAPNAGKSTLFNALIGARVSAESHKEGTTAEWVKGVAVVHNTQILLLDTPGVFHMTSKTKKARHLDKTFLSWDALKCADVAVLCLPVGLGFVDNEQKATIKESAHRAAARRLPLALALTMMDRITGPRANDAYFAMRSDLNTTGVAFAGVFETSAFRSQGLVDLKDFIARYGKPAKWEASATSVTTLEPPAVVFQLVKQACFSALPHVIPHRMRMEVFGWTKEADGVLEIAIELVFDSEAFMATFFGKMFEVREKARREISRELGKKVRLVFFPYLSERKVSTA